MTNPELNRINGLAPQFGDAGQIQQIKLHNMKVQGLIPVTTFEPDPHVVYGYGIVFKKFNCLNNRCKEPITWHFYINQLMDGDDIECPTCEARYEVREGEGTDFGIYWGESER